jgi:hypothetical protein
MDINNMVPFLNNMDSPTSFEGSGILGMILLAVTAVFIIFIFTILIKTCKYKGDSK